MQQKPATIELWLDAIENEGRGLTKWEIDFIESLVTQWAERHSLSDRQEELLERIYAEKTPC